MIWQFSSYGWYISKIFTGLFDICDSDSEQVVNNYDVIADLGKACSNDNLFNICESDSEQVVKNYNVIADLDKECSNDNLFETEIRGKYI